MNPRLQRALTLLYLSVVFTVVTVGMAMHVVACLRDHDTWFLVIGLMMAPVAVINGWLWLFGVV